MCEYPRNWEAISTKNQNRGAKTAAVCCVCSFCNHQPSVMFGWRWPPIHRRACVETVATAAKATFVNVVADPKVMALTFKDET